LQFLGFVFSCLTKLAGNVQLLLKLFFFMFFTYVLESKIDGRLYKGLTQNLDQRIIEHNSGKNKSTKAFRPWKLVYFEAFETRLEARIREKYFKTGSGRKFLVNKLKT